jgi:MYXO-CTERM domain-containing protein
LQAFSIQAWNTGFSGGSQEAAPISGDFYQDPVGADVASGFNLAVIAAFPDVVFDSYVSIGSAPVDADSTNAVSTVGVADGFGPFDTTGEVNGSFFAPGGTAQDSVDDRIFLGRFTLNSGELTGEVLVGNLNEGSGSLDTFVLGIGGGTNAPAGSVQAYQLVVEQSDFDGRAVNDLYIEAVPAPGAAGLLGFAGLAATRRRR